MTNEKLIAHLQKTLPMPLPKAQEIAHFFTLLNLKKDEFLLKEGKIAVYSHYLEKGYLRVYTHDSEGEEVTTAFFGGDMFANDVLSFFKRTPSVENFQALTDCTLWVINFDDLQKCFHNIPEFREFGRMMLINGYSKLKERAMEMIQFTAEQRYLKLLNANPEIFQKASLKMIASYLGITDTSFSRIRKELLKKK